MSDAHGGDHDDHGSDATGSTGNARRIVQGVLLTIAGLILVFWMRSMYYEAKAEQAKRDAAEEQSEIAMLRAAALQPPVPRCVNETRDFDVPDDGSLFMPLRQGWNATLLSENIPSSEENKKSCKGIYITKLGGSKPACAFPGQALDLGWTSERATFNFRPAQPNMKWKVRIKNCWD